MSATREITLTVNGVSYRRDARSEKASRRFSSSGSRPYRHTPRLRARRMWSLHSYRRWRTGAILPYACGAGGRCLSRHSRRSCVCDGALHPIQQAFRDKHGLQCGFCTPGMLTTLVAFLAEQPSADEAAIRDAISGNICRCTGYELIVDAALQAARSWPVKV